MRPPLIALIVVSTVHGAGAQTAQVTAPQPSFEVATIKPAAESASNSAILINPANFQIRHMTLRKIILFAYGIDNDGQLTGGPSWLEKNFFDIKANCDPDTVAALKRLSMTDQLLQMRAMLRSLLEDRFHLELGSRVEDLPAFALVIGRGGSKLKEVEAAPPLPSAPAAPDLLHTPPPPPPPPPPSNSAAVPSSVPVMAPKVATYAAAQRRTYFGYTGQSTVSGKNATLDMLVYWLAHQPELAGRIVVDRTGLRGKYDFVLDGVPPARPSEQWTGASLFTLVQEQLGLRLQPTKAAARVFVVDHVEEPTAN